eukprot:SAG31_NODE_3662_length_4011_cov_8.856851_4_plen_313_part_00
MVWIASITKTFTSALLFILRDEGVLSLEDPVAKFFGSEFGYKTPWPSAKPMTLGQLASHTSGLPRETPYYVCTADPTCANSETEREARILSAVAEQWLVVKPGTRFHYSNLGFALLGRALGHAVPGQSYEHLVTTRILTPLGMASATFTTPPSLDGVAVGLRPSGAVGLASHGDGWGAPAGDLLVSSNDMARWMQLWARRDWPLNASSAAAVGQILDGGTLDEILQPKVEMRDGRAAIGQPWEFLYSNGRWLKSKQGGDPGYRSSLTLSPDLDLGVFISVRAHTVTVHRRIAARHSEGAAGRLSCTALLYGL